MVEILDILERHIESHPEIEGDPDQWVVGVGWDQTKWNGWNGAFPTAVRAMPPR